MIWVIVRNNYQKLKRTIHILKSVDWESNPKLLFQIIYDQTYNHDFTKLTIHKFNNRFCLTLTDCFSLLPPQRVIFGHIIGQFRRIIGHHCCFYIKIRENRPKEKK